MSPASSPNSDRKRAILLLSGGLDSTTLLALVAGQGYEVHALTFSYGQRHMRETALAARSARQYDVASHRVVEIDLRAFGGSALTSDEYEVPRGRSGAAIADGIPVTYVPARNTIFLSFALAAAEVVGASEIFIGINAVDYSGYPDCRPEFVDAFENLAAVATKAAVEGGARVRVRAPLLRLSKSEIIALGNSLGVDYSATLSCYDPGADGEACGECDACQLRLKGFSDAGATDPAVYSQSASGEK
jgi:7-cyano-7-deazaguanine synthase